MLGHFGSATTNHRLLSRLTKLCDRSCWPLHHLWHRGEAITAGVASGRSSILNLLRLLSQTRLTIVPTLRHLLHRGGLKLLHRHHR